jgi:hypothetical protein
LFAGHFNGRGASVRVGEADEMRLHPHNIVLTFDPLEHYGVILKIVPQPLGELHDRFPPCAVLL